ncbi:DUF5686 family protein [Lutibacter sp. TH_r2]|uniref:DUF5686 and carboxypeptidase-like regulatory domain-containing protein n=1 Tax=Lutibacter sp. TH_r2 TaxID=3082083 RepID=UPI002953A3FA|nr:DUF5686 family protein [Lutibacter sp. TH_r2]MDV7186164.1 DUF5686 family protein [Lutibacter sp. TH_r2]
MNKFLLIILFFPAVIFSQTAIQGIVLDSKTNKPLPFASVITSTNFGALTNVDGTFTIKTKSKFTTLKISYIGYSSVIVPISEKDKFIRVKLEQTVESLNEIVITAKENPAIKLIKKVIANTSKNNIEKALNSFKFKAYNKILVTANPDSIRGNIDTIFVLKKGEKVFKKLDSNNYKFKKELEKTHIYLTEKISEFKFKKGSKKKEVVLASRMAGLKQPLYELLAITIQDFSFYNEYYTLAGSRYINPVSKNALKHYSYKILDTVTIQNKETIMLYFRPTETKETVGLEGILYIDSQNFGIAKGIAELKAIVNVKAEQNYQYKPAQKIWFPTDQEIIIKKGENKKNTNLFGGMVQFSTNKPNDSIVKTAKKDPSDVSYFSSKTINSEIEINKPIKISNSATTIKFEENAHKKSTKFWNTYRTDSITKRGKETYILLDSLAEKEGVNRKINLARNLLKGYYPTKYVNLNLGKIINLNNYEGLRVGFGGITNSSFSNKFKLESYVAYGTKDKEFKYSYGASVRFNKESNTWFGIQHTNDIEEAASLHFIKENTSFSPINPRNLNISKFFNYKTYSANITHDIQPNLEAKIKFTTGKFKPLFNYQFISEGETYTNYNLSTASIGIQYNPFSEYMNSPIGKLTIKNNFPQITFQVSKSLKDIFESDFDFTQINFRILHKIDRLRKATTTFMLEGGAVFGDAPLTHLYNSTPNYTHKSPWIKRVTFAGKNSFETMGYNEFISDRYIALHFKHDLKPIKITNKFRPQFTFVSRAAVGAIDNKQFHTGIDFKSLKNGYYESGLELNGLFKGFGASAFYRYGPNQNAKVSDNLAVKLTFKLNLGF